jgi:anti-sigma B factor antagonist
MAVSERQETNAKVLDISGRITIGQGDVEIRDAVQLALAEGNRNILLVMDGVTALDSAGVGELVAAHTSAKNRGGSLKLAKLSRKVASVLQATRLVGILDVYDTEKEALDSFAS